MFGSDCIVTEALACAMQQQPSTLKVQRKQMSAVTHAASLLSEFAASQLLGLLPAGLKAVEECLAAEGASRCVTVRPVSGAQSLRTARSRVFRPYPCAKCKLDDADGECNLIFRASYTCALMSH
jgi:hypothetical protein